MHILQFELNRSETISKERKEFDQMAEEETEGKSLPETPSWAVASVIAVMVCVGFLVQGSLTKFGKWLTNTRRTALSSALEKIKEELMLFGLMSLLMGHFSIWVSKICVKSSALSGQFYPCFVEGYHEANYDDLKNSTAAQERGSCPEGRVPFASYESLEQLHRLLFVLGVVHVSYSFTSIALALLKIYSWTRWENQAKALFDPDLAGSTGAGARNLTRLSTFLSHHTSHPWSHNKFFALMLSFSRQFWSSINRADYMALRLGFITNHELPLSYDFHSYMLRSMDDEFRDIVGISVPLWVYAIFCIFLNFHGTIVYFCLSFTPAIFILLVGTKLHYIVIKLALEVTETNAQRGMVNLRDDLFWFGKPKLLLMLIQLITFQNALEMATFIWSLWEIKGPSCFMENHLFIVIRLTSGVIFQFWCSSITFPLYVIITQMGSKFKKSVVTEGVRESLCGWRNRAKKSKQGSSHGALLLHATSDSTTYYTAGPDTPTFSETVSTSNKSSSRLLMGSSSFRRFNAVEGEICEESPRNNNPSDRRGSGRHYHHGSHSEEVNEKDELHRLHKETF